MRFSRFSIRICHRCIKLASWCRERERERNQRVGEEEDRITAFLRTLLHRRRESRTLSARTSFLHPVILNTLSAENCTHAASNLYRECAQEYKRERAVYLDSPRMFTRHTRAFLPVQNGSLQIEELCTRTFQLVFLTRN